MNRCVVVVLTFGAVCVSGCGVAGATPRTAAGVRADYRSFVQLLASGKGKQACAEYVSRGMKTAIAAEKHGSCAEQFESAWTKDRTTPSAATAALRVLGVDGNRATIKTKRGTRAMVYAGGHWQDNAFGYTLTATSSGGETFSITTAPDGSVTRTCNRAGENGCSPTGTW